MTAPKDEETAQGHCPQCGPDRFADVVGHHHHAWRDDDIGIWGDIDYRILKCRGCRTVFFQTDEVFSEDLEHRRLPGREEWEAYIPHKITYWPSPTKREPPNWRYGLDVADQQLGSLFDDVYGALNADLRIPAAIAIRTTFDRASELLGVDPAAPFAQKLSELVSRGTIGSHEKDALDALTDAGNAAAHRGWRPEPAELETMISLLETFLHRAFVLGDAARKLKASVPPRPKRKKAAKD